MLNFGAPTLFGNIFMSMPKAALHAMAVPMPSRNRRRYERPMKAPTSLK